MALAVRQSGWVEANAGGLGSNRGVAMSSDNPLSASLADLQARAEQNLRNQQQQKEAALERKAAASPPVAAAATVPPPKTKKRRIEPR